MDYVTIIFKHISNKQKKQTLNNFWSQIYYKLGFNSYSDNNDIDLLRCAMRGVYYIKSL